MAISKYLAEQNLEFLFNDTEYYPSFKYYTSEFVIHNDLKYTTFSQFGIVLLVPNRSLRI